MSDFDTAFPRSRTDNKDYAGHPVFADLEYCIQFYDQISFSIPYCPADGKLITNMDVFVYSSIQGTLESVQHVLKSGRIGDAYALLRKYYDSVIINVYTNLYLEENRSLKSSAIEKITKWFDSTEQLPDYRQMSQYIRASSILTPMTNLLNADDRYKKVRNRCNDSLHYNFFQNVLINDNQLHWQDRSQWLDLLSEDIKAIFILHLSYIFFLHSHYMMSSDYVDALEVGMVPEKDSQYWVAPFVQKAFDDIITKERPEITALIKQNSCMQLSDGKSQE